MKRLDGRADAVVVAPMATCLSVLAAVERYPSWSGEFIRAVTVLERDPAGLPVRPHVVVHVAQSPFGKTFEFDAAIYSEPPRAVHLNRLPSRSSDADRLSLSTPPTLLPCRRRRRSSRVGVGEPGANRV